MNLLDTLKQFKNITPDPARKEISKRAILATLPRQHWSAWRSIAAIFETGVAVALAVFFILVITAQLSGNSYVSPVQFSAIDPKTLNAEAQAVDIQIQLANVAYQESTTTSVVASADASTPQAAAAVVGAVHPAFTAAILSATSTAGSSSSSTPTSTTISVDQALKALSE
jgi:hypothetical protein